MAFSLEAILIEPYTLGVSDPLASVKLDVRALLADG